MMRRHLHVFALCLVLAGCGSGSFLGRRYDNFTAYYNTFYNARKSYDRGVKSLAREDEPVNRQLYLPIFTAPDKASRSKDFSNAIKKSADLLREHPDSKWVDNALLLIGKSYFYQQNYVGAEQKFHEVIDLATSLEDEAHFWLSRSLIASAAYEEAADQLQESLRREGVSKRWASMLHLAMGALYVKQQAWEQAASEVEQGLKNVPDQDVGSRAQFLLGQLYETMGQYGKAVAAFDRVGHFNPLYELAYAAKISAVRVEGKYGDAKDALQRLRKMERDDNNFGYRAEIAYMRGRLYQDMGRANKARDTYESLLYDRDPTTNITTVRGRVQYALGELYRDVYQDYVFAAAYFDTAATAVRPGTSGQSGRRSVSKDVTSLGLYSMEAITDGDERKEQFDSYASVYEQVARMDSLLALGRLDQPSFDERILEMRRQQAAVLTAQREARASRAIDQSFSKRTDTNALPGQSGGLPAGKIIPQGNAPRSSGDTGFLNSNNPIQAQEGRMNFLDIWGDRPLVPNWRRLDAISGSRASGVSGAVPDSVLQTIDNGLDELPKLDISAIPRDSLSQETMRAQRAVARYELANVLFLAINRPDSAAVWYRKVIDEDGDQPVAQRAYYALAEVHRALGDEEAAKRLYEKVLQVSSATDFAERVRQHLGQEEEDSTPDSTMLAERAYAKAYSLWQNGDYGIALNKMILVAGTYPTTPLPPQALYAAGAVYAEWAVRDSLDLFAPIPLSMPDSVLRSSGLLSDSTSTDLASPSAEEPGTASGPLLPDSLQTVNLDSLQATFKEPRAGVSVDSLQTALAEGPQDAAIDSLQTVQVEAPQATNVDSSQTGGTNMPQIIAAGPHQSNRVDSLQAPVLTTTNAGRNAKPSSSIFLSKLYETLIANYAETPYAKRARQMLDALEEIQQGLSGKTSVPADSLIIVPDSLSTLATDSLMLAPDSSIVVNPRENAMPEGLNRKPESGPDTVPNVHLRDPDDLRLKKMLSQDEIAPIPKDSTQQAAADSVQMPIKKGVDELPKIVGGLDSLQQRMRYPAEAQKSRVSGRVLLDILVDQKGHPTNIMVTEGVGAGCDKEAVDIVKMAHFNPAMKGGEPVRAKLSLQLQCGPLN